MRWLRWVGVAVVLWVAAFCAVFRVEGRERSPFTLGPVPRGWIAAADSIWTFPLWVPLIWVWQEWRGEPR